jgi:hypothetical protein
MNKSESIQNLSAALSKAQAEMPELFSKLSEPFPSEAIDWRVGATNSDKSKGIALAYLQARPVMDRLDEAIGPENWADTYAPIQDINGTVGFICTLSLRINGEWVSKTDGADTSDIEAIKGGISDAFKRAAVKWGVGRYLYDLPNIWVPVEARGKSFVLKETPKLPDWALPKKKIKSKAENPDPMTDFLVETFAVDAPSKVEAKQTNNGNKWARPMPPEVLKEALQRKAAKSNPASEKQTNLVRVLLIEHFADREDERRQAQEYLTGHKSFKDIEPEMISAILDWMKPEKATDGSGAYVLGKDAKVELTMVARKFMEDLGQQALAI